MAVLRQLFGPSRDEVWRQLATELDARMIDGGWWKSPKVEVRVGQWIVTLDTYTVSTGKTTIVFTRMRAPYVNADGFRFTVYRRGFFSDLGKWLGMQDIEVGDEQFDRDFIVKGNDESRIRHLLANARIRELIQAQPRFHLEVKDDEGWFGAKFPDGVDELCFQVTGVIKDVELLKPLFALFAETLHQLCRIGAAYERDPEVTL